MKSKTSRGHVTKTAIEIGRLWAAHAAAEATKYHDNPLDVKEEYIGISDQIEEWRQTLETSVSYTRARSLSDALVHVVLASEVAKDLVSHIDPEPDERLMAHSLYRMLSSVALLLREEIGDDFAPLAEFWRTYVGEGFQDDNGRPAMWLDKIPALVAADREQRRA